MTAPRELMMRADALSGRLETLVERGRKLTGSSRAFSPGSKSDTPGRLLAIIEEAERVCEDLEKKRAGGESA